MILTTEFLETQGYLKKFKNTNNEQKQFFHKKLFEKKANRIRGLRHIYDIYVTHEKTQIEIYKTTYLNVKFIRSKCILTCKDVNEEILICLENVFKK